jgi:hypothetical protein
MTAPSPQQPVKRRAGREGKGMIAAWADETICTEIRVAAARRNTTVQEIVLRGIDLWFRENGLPEIASTRRDAVA